MARGKDEDGPHPVDLHVGCRIQKKRIALGHNQSDLARALGLTFQQIQKYEKGANRISASKLWETAGFFKVDVDYFYAGLAERSPMQAGGLRSDDAPQPTRHSLEIARLAPQLSVRQQRLALELMRSIARRGETDEA